jgi:hypothetical protein
MDGVWPLDKALTALDAAANDPRNRVWALPLWLAYRLGKPIDRKDITTDGQALTMPTIIEIVKAQD